MEHGQATVHAIMKGIWRRDFQAEASRMTAPVLHSVSVKSAAGLPGAYARHGIHVLSEEQDDRGDGLTTSYEHV